jgi:hypothetical protein
MKDVFWSKDGVRNEIKWNNNGETIVSRYQPVDHIIDSVREAGKLTQNKASHLKLAGRVPIDLHNQWTQEGKKRGLEGEYLHAFLLGKLNDYNYKKLRVDGQKL